MVDRDILASVIWQNHHRASLLSCKRANLSSVIWQICYPANLLFGIPVIWQQCHMQICISENVLHGKPGYLAYLLSGSAVIGQAHHLANVQICPPLSGRSVIWQSCYLAYPLRPATPRPARRAPGRPARSRPAGVGMRGGWPNKKGMLGGRPNL